MSRALELAALMSMEIFGPHQHQFRERGHVGHVFIAAAPELKCVVKRRECKRAFYFAHDAKPDRFPESD